ncbi:DUF6262 family protein [Rhodococcus opacus]|uniref:DUF6262 family protein n=1 Tax=Rhodococcus opacus TaxID=37919 RepID=UPI0007CD5082|nr:DUF6262 family protein [Rhodococcus opacus]RZI53546.1 MAG: hypothetical protein EOP16_02265 [Pseudonocardia sp.]MDX5962386.1 DUF6262 family protein [Rhodococcus opacus]MDX5962788.1 DUF6262 family protein [Rhodococcus opacus]MDX5969712.1 DUF6262 family protein [Rhodococcus opacus]NKY70025.1 hypothetical protein [Rhodococcus opacus]
MTHTPETDSRAERIGRLKASRQRDSAEKTRRCLRAVDDLIRAGERITVTGVARDAAVSTWFIYNQTAVRGAVESAIAEQAETRSIVRTSRPTTVTSASLHTELALAREEVRSLRTERDQLRTRVQLALGSQLDGVSHERLVSRIQNLEQRKTELESEVEKANMRVLTAEERAAGLEDDLVAARSGLKRMMQSRSPTGFGVDDE